MLTVTPLPCELRDPQFVLFFATDGDDVSTGLSSAGDATDVVHSLPNSRDDWVKQLNNLAARMTLAENQLMLQVLVGICWLSSVTV